MSQVSLRKFQTFGDVAAEDDAVLDYFLSTNAVERIEKRQAFLVLGRKGTGKTAIVRYLTEGNKRPLSKALNLRGYPWKVHGGRIDHGASTRKTGRLHVRRAKRGTPSVHPIRGDEIRALRRLRRENPTEAHVFVSERGANF